VDQVQGLHMSLPRLVSRLGFLCNSTAHPPAVLAETLCALSQLGAAQSLPRLPRAPPQTSRVMAPPRPVSKMQKPALPSLSSVSPNL